MSRLGTLIVVSFLLLGACGQVDPTADSKTAGHPSPTPAPTAPAVPAPAAASKDPTPSASPVVIGTIASGLDVPWGVAFLPDRTALVTERDSGRVLQVSGKSVRTVGQVREARANGEAGLLGVAVSPSFATDQQVFLYASTDGDNRVLRTTLRDGRLGALTPILTGIPLGSNHDGGRMLFGPDRMLYVSTGEAGRPDLAQDRGSLGGKILRITSDGQPAPGNPDPGSPVWTWGHRNVQGLAFDSDGDLWVSEFGQDAFDELNLIEKGRNYGWPMVEGKGGRPGLQDPQVTWSTDESSPSGLAFLDGRLWLGALRGERLWRIDVNGRRASGEKGFFVGTYGRLRTVVAAPDGNLWVTTSNRDGRGHPAADDDRILLVRP
ncbi:MAG: glucose sorbosone dehydrogenase [Marmoricola sp.]|jgi:glucose/arabinose dehydrogenase|nr:glucose sorbosone dehydrogenase [Marmoricola sp.]MCW2827448.1 glucose sorbosone dehydrogenase [Marmoricola sp.]